MRKSLGERIFEAILPWVGVLVALFVVFVILLLTISTVCKAAPPFESRSYPTVSITTMPSAPVIPGYRRVYASWSAQVVDSVSYSKYRKPPTIAHHLCTIPAGAAIYDEPLNPAIHLLVLLGGKRCDAGRAAIWSVYRGSEDWTRYVGSRMYQPGQPRTLSLYPARDETVVVKRTH